MTRTGGAAIWLMAMLAAAAAMGTDGAPTGAAAADGILRGIMAAVVVLGAAHAPRGALLAAAAVVACTAGVADGAMVAAIAASVLALVACLPHEGNPNIGAATGTFLSWAILHLRWPTTERGTALAALLVVSVLVGSAAWTHAGRWRRRVVISGGLLVLVCSGATAVYLRTVLVERDRVRSTIDELEVALALARGGDSAGAEQHFDAVVAHLDELDGRLGRWWMRPARVVPVFGHQVGAIDALIKGARGVAAAASAAASVVDPDDLRPNDYRVDLAKVDALALPLDQLSDAIDSARNVTGSARSPWLAPELDEQLDILRDRTQRATRQVNSARQSVALIPELLGSEGRRTWYLALGTPSLLRGTGGFTGSYAILTTDHGRLELERVGRIDELIDEAASTNIGAQGNVEYLRRYRDVFSLDERLQNFTATPHFPSAAEAIAEWYEAIRGVRVDGVIYVDPYAYADLLTLTGPVRVAQWPEPLTSANAARVLLFDQYATLERDTRAELIELATRQLFEQVGLGRIPGPADMGAVLSETVAQKRLMLWSRQQAEQRWFTTLAASGALPKSHADVLNVVVNNATSTQIDWFLHRSIDYSVDVDPASGEIAAVLRVALRNDAPAEGLPSTILGPVDATSPPAGVNRSFVSVFTPHELVRASINGVPVVTSSGEEQGLEVHETFVLTPPGKTSVLELELRGRIPVGGGTYRLTLVRQPTVWPDDVTLDVDPGPGWTADEGARKVVLNRDLRVVVPLRPADHSP